MLSRCIPQAVRSRFEFTQAPWIGHSSGRGDKSWAPFPPQLLQSARDARRDSRPFPLPKPLVGALLSRPIA